MQNNILEVGDVIRIERFGYWHAGVYVGSQTWSGGPDVVHNKKGDGVVLSRLAEFADGCPVIIDQKAIGNFWQRRTIAQRALSLIGKKYDLINFNCEHVVHYAQSGKPESPQIVAAGIAALVLIGIAILGQRS